MSGTKEKYQSPKIRDQIDAKRLNNLFWHILFIPLYICFPLLLIYPIIKYSFKGRGLEEMAQRGESEEDIL